MQHIIGLTGIRGAGKDTAASILEAHYGFKRIAFATALYAEVAGAFGTTVERLGTRENKELSQAYLGLASCTDAAFVTVALKAGLCRASNSPRAVLQVWGTEYRRVQEDRYWLKQVEEQVQAHPLTNFAITDCRYKNEAGMLPELGGELIRVQRSGIEAAWAQDERSQHQSERDLLDAPVSCTLINVEDDLEYLEDQLRIHMCAVAHRAARDLQAA